CDIGGGVPPVGAVIGAVVGSLDDVGAVVGQDSGQAVQGAGIIGEVNPQADEASVFHQSALDNAREQGDVDVAATDQDRDSFRLQRQLTVQDGGDGCGSRSPGQSFSAPPRREDGVGDLFFFH